MILYTNGDSHTAGAEAINAYAFAEDDHKYWNLKRRPHPDNLAVSWGPNLANILKMSFHTDAESASSNDRIIRTTTEWIDHISSAVNPKDVFMIIQFSTWEREEWLIAGTYYQVNASGEDQVPIETVQRYKEYIANVNWEEKTKDAFDKIKEFHLMLTKLGFKHIFFNGNNCFSEVTDRYDFGNSYMEPYTQEATFDGYLRNLGFDTVITSNYHFGPASHAAWTKHLIQHITQNKMV